MLQLTRDLPNVQLALSLHAPTQEMRARIVPAARAFKLDKVMGKVIVSEGWRFVAAVDASLSRQRPWTIMCSRAGRVS